MYGSNRSGLGADACPRPPFSLPDLSSQANYHQDRRRKSMSHTIQDRTATRFLARNFLPNSGVISRHARGNKGRWIALPLLFLGAGLMLVQPCASAPFEFEVTGSLGTPRLDHTATLLPNGKVLVAGGDFLFGVLASAELYDPASGTWTATGSLVTGRSAHTATLLPDGKVLVAAGDNGGSLASAELYDPDSGIWTATGGLANPRLGQTATLLPNGKVLVAGGYNPTPGALPTAHRQGAAPVASFPDSLHPLPPYIPPRPTLLPHS